jgi:mannose-1-phosphate guanylyltransferase
VELVAVIMAGGKGERFWPKSRANYPKQFLKLFGDRTLIQHTVDRILPLISSKNVFIVTNAVYKQTVIEQLPELPEENIIIEPVGRNTAPCIGLAAIHIGKKIPDSVMFVLPSDHMILDVSNYLNVLKQAAKLAKNENALVTLGIRPDKPETGYGYIKFSHEGKSGAYKVEKFVEKPNREVAEQYLASGQYLWNSGMFIWRTDVILMEFKKHLPESYRILKNIKSSLHSSNFTDVLTREFPKMESISIDYGIMEKAENIYVYPSEFGWDDVGSWTAIERLAGLDSNGNILNGDIIALNSRNCTIEGNSRLIAAVGLDNLIIVDTDDAILICNKDQAQSIKEVLSELKNRNRTNLL